MDAPGRFYRRLFLTLEDGEGRSFEYIVFLESEQHWWLLDRTRWRKDRGLYFSLFYSQNLN